MAIKPTTRDYKFSDATLKQKADGIRDNVVRDQTDFTDRGVTDVVAFEGLIDNFDNELEDIYYVGMIGIKVQERDTAEEALLKAIKTLRTAVQNVYGEGDANYRIYRFDRLAQADGDTLVRLARTMNNTATTQLTDLAAEGITPTKLSDMMVLREALDTKIDEVEMAHKNRDMATQNRIVAGNILYKEMVRLTNIGKDLYAQTNEAKYNDYILYNSPSGSTPPMQPPVPAPNMALATGAATNNTNGSALAAATVIFERNGTTVATLTTANNGTYTTPELAPANDYTVRFTATGFDPLVLTSVNLTAGMVTHLDGALMPEV